MRIFPAAMTFVLLTAAAGMAQAAPDRDPTPIATTKSTAQAPDVALEQQLADFDGTARPGKFDVAPEDMVLYSVLSDQIREMRRKSALPAVMCLAESNSDGTAQTVRGGVMEKLISDNDAAGDGLFTLKQATECKTSGNRIVDAETETRAVLVTAGPMEDSSKDLMAG